MWNLKGVKPRVYHADDLTEQPVVVVVEGEKDTDRLWSLDIPATTNSGGALKWRDIHTAQLVASGITHVHVIPDNDQPGHAHAAHVARSCAAAGLTVKVLDLPGKDVSAYLDAGGTKADLFALIKRTPVYTADVVTEVELATVLDEVEGVIKKYVALSDDQAAVVALWVLSTWALDAFDCLAYLQVTSATKRAGKTRLLEVLDLLGGRG